MIFNLKGKSALLTGASGGIGSAIAKALHAQGAELILNGTRLFELESLAAKLGDRALVLKGDLNETNGINDLAEEAERMSDNGIDILINNAGITRDNLLVRLSDQDLMDVINLNLVAGFHLTRKILRGIFLNLSSGLKQTLMLCAYVITMLFITHCKCVWVSRV